MSGSCAIGSLGDGLDVPVGGGVLFALDGDALGGPVVGSLDGGEEVGPSVGGREDGPGVGALSVEGGEVGCSVSI